MKRSHIIIIAVVAALALGGYIVLREPPVVTPDTEVEAIEGFTVTYLATAPLFDELGLHPRRDFGVAANGNLIIGADEGVYELEITNGELGVAQLSDAVLDSLAVDGGAAILGLQGRFFGQLGPDGFQKALPLPDGELRVAQSSRAGWVYLFRNDANGEGRLYGIWDNGTLSTLVEFPGAIHAVADDERTTYVATHNGLFAIDADKAQVISKTTQDFGVVSSLAAGNGLVFLAANERVYVLQNDTLLALARGVTANLVLVGHKLYCLDLRRRLLFMIDVGPLFGK